MCVHEDNVEDNIVWLLLLRETLQQYDDTFRLWKWKFCGRGLRLSVQKIFQHGRDENRNNKKKWWAEKFSSKIIVSLFELYNRIIFVSLKKSTKQHENHIKLLSGKKSKRKKKKFELKKNFFFLKNKKWWKFH